MHEASGKYVCSNSTFVANLARNAGGAIYVDTSPSMEIINCTFIGNVATNAGGAIYMSTKDCPKVRNCTFASNNVATVANTLTSYGGGAIYSPCPPRRTRSPTVRLSATGRSATTAEPS